MAIETAVQILLVEDNPDDEELIRLALKRCGYTDELFVVRDGEEALEFIFSNKRYSHRRGVLPPKVVLLDIKLPMLDGLEVLHMMKGDPHTRRVPVVLLTSSSQDRDIAMGYDFGANSYIVKPVDFERFTELLGLCASYWLRINTSPVL